MEKAKKPSVHRTCCVKTCMSTNLSLPKRSFFTIPNIKVGQGNKRERWITALKSVNGESWNPRIGIDFVCSSHFTSGTHSLVQWDDDYVPHIFNDDFQKYKKLEEVAQ